MLFIKNPFLSGFKSFFLFLFAFGLGPVAAQTTLLPGHDRTNALDNTSDMPRSAAMGSAFVGVADDASALFSNPAGLGSLDRGQISVNSDLWLVGTFQETVLLGLSTAQWGGFGLSLHYLNYGSFEGRDAFGAETPTYGANRWGFQVGWGYGILQDLFFGVSLGDSQTSLDGTGFDHPFTNVGILWNVGQGFRLGAAYVNGGLSILGSPSADAFNMGASYAAPLDPETDFLAAVGGSVEPGGVQFLQGGIEVTIRKSIFLRAGCQAPLSDMGLIGLTNLTAGIGFRFSDMALDYAFLPYGELGTAHRISLGYEFEALDGKPRTKVAAIPAEPPKATPVPTPTMVAPRSVSGPLEKDSLVVQFEDPGDVGPDTGEGAVLGSMERVNAALAAVKADPQSAYAWCVLGNAYREIDRKDYAVKCYESVLKLQPNNKKFAKWLEKYKNAKP